MRRGPGGAAHPLLQLLSLAVGDATRGQWDAAAASATLWFGDPASVSSSDPALPALEHAAVRPNRGPLPHLPPLPTSPGQPARGGGNEIASLGAFQGLGLGVGDCAPQRPVLGSWPPRARPPASRDESPPEARPSPWTRNQSLSIMRHSL